MVDFYEIWDPTGEKRKEIAKQKTESVARAKASHAGIYVGNWNNKKKSNVGVGSVANMPEQKRMNKKVNVEVVTKMGELLSSRATKAMSTKVSKARMKK